MMSQISKNQIEDTDIVPLVAPFVTSSALMRTELLPSIELLHPHRFDLIAKFLYAKYRSYGKDLDWQRELYLDHIRVFNGLFENDGSGKYGKTGFLSAFDSVLDSVDKQGFDSELGYLPISRDGVLLDGAHRAAACLHQGKNVTCARFDIEAPNYNYRWFRNRGLPEQWLDAMATELCRLKHDTFIVLIYPRAVGRDAELRALIEAYGDLWYDKTVMLTGNGPVNIIRQVYAEEPWVGSWRNGFAGARNKASWCFQGDGPLRVFVVESDLERMVSLKQAVRDLYQVENHSIHINDTHLETLQLAGMLLNSNSIHFLNRCNLTERSWFLRLFQYYKQWIMAAGMNPENYCIDGSAVMAAYGIREARDIDFLHLGEYADTGYKEISSHNHEVNNYKNSIESLILDPRNYFYYSDCKFLCLNILRDMKARRGESKDNEDIQLMDKVETQNKSNIIVRMSDAIRYIASPKQWVREARMLAFKLRFIIRKILNSNQKKD